MASNKENKAAEAAALLTQNLEVAELALANATEDATAEEKQQLQDAVDQAKKAIEDAKAPKTAKASKMVAVKFLLSPTGKFGLGYSAGEVGEFEEKQATELVEAKYAEYVK
jgi:hypothetical protein